MFRAFFNLSADEVENMTMQEYIDYCITFNDVVKLWHAPFNNMKNIGG